jgi:hypothetical protein
MRGRAARRERAEREALAGCGAGRGALPGRRRKAGAGRRQQKQREEKAMTDDATGSANVREILAPCGLDCGKCLANPGSRIARLARELREELGGFADHVPLFSQFNPVFAKYPEFAAMLDHLADGGTCAGCRSGNCLFAGCEVSRCTRERGVGYCCECAEFPCAKVNLPGRLDVLWKQCSEAVRDMGAEAYYATIKDRPRYPKIK